MRGQVRIIGGKWRRRLLPVGLHGNVRPTPDRVRETLFNWLEPYIQGATCLDLFAGTGVLGFEAASRGADAVTMIERHPDIVAMLRDQVIKLGADNVQLIDADALHWLETTTTRFDVVFLDPPYGQYELPDLCRRLAPCLSQQGAQVYFEAPEDVSDAALPAGWRIMRRQHAGLVKYHWASTREARDIQV